MKYRVVYNIKEWEHVEIKTVNKNGAKKSNCSPFSK